MIDIRIHTIPHEKQRYETAGDWDFAPDGSLDIYVSDMQNPDAEFLCAVHELVEVWLARKRGVTQAEVDKFDMEWQGTPENPDEPGCDPMSPYHRDHEAGEVIERVLAQLMGVDWHEYNKAYDRLGA